MVFSLWGLALLSACAALPGEELHEDELVAAENSDEEVAGTSAALLPRFQTIKWEHGGGLPVPETNARNGDAVALSGNEAFVSCSTDDHRSCVDRYVRLPLLFNGQWVKVWLHRQRMTAPGGGTERFGSSLAVDGETLAVGASASFAQNNLGAVYVYERGEQGWAHAQTLRPPAGHVEDGDLEFNFGAALHLSNDLLVVGANRFGRGKGTAFIYERVAGRFQFRQRLEAVPSVTDMNFGTQVASMGDLVLVAEPGAGLMPRNDGRIWVYRRSGDLWVHDHTLAVSGRKDAADYFGRAMAVHDDRLAVRSYDSLHLYELRSGRIEHLWTRAAQVAGVPEQGSVAMDSGSILVGYPAATNDELAFSGKVVSYAHNASLWPIWLTSSAPAASAYFGKALALDGNLAVIAEPERTHEAGKGHLYSFDRSLIVPIF